MWHSSSRNTLLDSGKFKSFLNANIPNWYLSPTLLMLGNQIQTSDLTAEICGNN